jgi:hypothetical protein
MGTAGFISGGESGRDVKLNTHLYLMPRPRMVELYHSLIRLHDIVLNFIIKYGDIFTS